MQTLVKVKTVGFEGTTQADLHARFERRRTLRGALDAEEARDLRAAERMMLWEQAGCVTLVEYLARHAGLSERVAWERIRVATALGELPAIEDEMEGGRYSYSHVRELVRVVVPATENAWIDHTRGMTVSQVAREISGHERGDWPDDEKTPDEEWRTLALRVRPSTLARFTAIVKGLEDETPPCQGGALDSSQGEEVLREDRHTCRCRTRPSCTRCSPCTPRRLPSSQCRHQACR